MENGNQVNGFCKVKNSPSLSGFLCVQAMAGECSEFGGDNASHSPLIDRSDLLHPKLAIGTSGVIYAELVLSCIRGMGYGCFNFLFGGGNLTFETRK